MKPELLSIVVPVYNSSEMLEELHASIQKSLDGKQKFELILVDDGSKDLSWEKIEELKTKFPDHIRGIRLSKNFGQHNALLCGFSFATGDVVLTMDDDLQHPPSEIPKLLEKFDETGADVVYGIYNSKQHNAVRNAGTSFLKAGTKVFVGDNGIGSSFRLMKKTIVNQIVLHKHQAHVFIDEILHWYTAKFSYVAVEHHPRKTGKSGFTFTKLVVMYFDIVINYTALPLKLMTWIGLISSLTTFGLAIRFIYRKFILHLPPEGFTAIIVTVLFSTSLLMFCMGIIGQYLYKIYHLQSRRPPYSIDTIL
jgi:glycosyltransferase involved in cell wall biosynthesis